MTNPPIEAVEIDVGAGITLRGQVWAGGDAWIILLHDIGKEEDLDRWVPLDATLASRAWSVLSVDLRGHGASDGEWDPAAAREDVAAIVARARERGASFVGIAAAGSSAVNVLRLAGDIKADALVLLSPALDPDEPISDLRGAGEAKLILVGGGDPSARACGERLCKAAIGWVMLVNLPSRERGTALLIGPAAPHLLEHVVRFLGEQRHLARLRAHGSGGGGARRRAGSFPAPGLASRQGIERT